MGLRVYVQGQGAVFTSTKKTANGSPAIHGFYNYVDLLVVLLWLVLITTIITTAATISRSTPKLLLLVPLHMRI